MTTTRLATDIECRFDVLDAPHGDKNVLGRVVYGASSGRPLIDKGVPTLPMKMFHNASDGFAERWTTSKKAHSGSSGDLVFSHDDAILFCAGFIPASKRYTEAAQTIYADAFRLIDKLRFPHIFRMWNFIPDINGENEEGLEIYRDFCRGRALAFERHYAIERGMPSATGVGTSGDGIGFYFLACRESAVKHVENSRQTPAYDYPLQYGPKAPSFARGTVLSAQTDRLFVSGTASILGHKSVHEGDAEKQCEVALSNIAHLIGAENLEAQGLNAGFSLHDLDCIKLYYRRSDDLSSVMNMCRRAFHPQADIRAIQVDICREELLVELEGIAKKR